MKRFLILGVILLCLGAIGVGLWRVLDFQVLSANQFPTKTSINGVDCSGLSMDQAEVRLSNAWNQKKLRVIKDETEIAAFDHPDFSYELEYHLRDAQRSHFFRAAARYFFGVPFRITIPMKAVGVSPAFRTQVLTCKALQPANPVQTKNASIDFSSKTLEILPQVYGNTLDYQRLIQDMMKDVTTDDMRFTFHPETYYIRPTLTADSPELKAQQKFYRTYLLDKMTWLFGKQEVPLPAAELQKLLTVTPQGDSAKVTVKKAEVRAYVKKLAQAYDTLGKKRRFKALSGKNITVSGGDYGFVIDQKKEVRQLAKDLKSQKKIKRAPIWAQKGEGAYDQNNDLGNTYVEISISGQRLWFFKKGKKILECPVVTGSVAQGTMTPPGTYSLTFKERNATLKGYNTDGTTYESPVSYWMPFYRNVGMHDAPWRSSFGGKIYKQGGSHGCVNMPPQSAAKLYRHLPGPGMPVVVHR